MVTRSVVSVETYKAAVAAGAIIPPSAAVDVSLQNTSNERADKQTQSFNNESRTDSSQLPSQLGWRDGSKIDKPRGLIQLCCHSGCVNVANFRRGYGFCPLHQAKSIATEQSNSSESQEKAFDDRCIREASSDEGHGDKHLAAHGSNCSSSDVGKKRVCPSEDPTSVKKMTKRQRLDTFRMDLSDVPPQLPIPKRGKRIKEGASQYQGVSFNKQKNTWDAKIFIEGKLRHIGCYEKEEDAATDYARAVFKYRGKSRVLDDCNVEQAESMAVEQSEVTQRQRRSTFTIDLSDVPPQLPIPKRGKRIKEGASQYQGVSFIKQSNKWMAQIVIEGKLRYIGGYDKEEDAGIDYARAVFKYRGKRRVLDDCNAGQAESMTGEQNEVTQRQSSSAIVIDLSDAPPQFPIPKRGNRIKEGASQYQGVSFIKQSNKWMAQIVIEGKLHYIGSYDNEDDAAIDYARAVLKYKGQKAIDKARAQANVIVDLSDVPMQSPILKSEKTKEGQSKYQGVCFHKQRNKWLAQITTEGKNQHIGYYEKEEDAAADYARAVFKYRGQKD